jgi:hypothetical protein
MELSLAPTARKHEADRIAEDLRYLTSWRSAVLVILVVLSACGDDGGLPFDSLQVEAPSIPGR